MSNIDTLNDFLRTINDRQGPHYHSVDHLMTLFCNDDANQEIPFVGIAWRGPQFKHRGHIRKLFTRLLVISFENMAWTPANDLRMRDGDTIAVEVDVTAKHVREWFTDSFRSPPLSHIDQAAIDALGASKKSMNVPACAVFTFDGNHEIRQLAIYMDRYRMMDQLAPSHWTHVGLPEGTHPPRGPVGEARGRRITITIED
jgi:hypothetical protein